jgi:hypothetical protein
MEFLVKSCFFFILASLSGVRYVGYSFQKRRARQRSRVAPANLDGEKKKQY